MFEYCVFVLSMWAGEMSSFVCYSWTLKRLSANYSLFEFFIIFILVLLFVSCEKFGSPYLGKAQQPQEQRYPFLSVCAVFPCVQTMV